MHRNVVAPVQGLRSYVAARHTIVWRYHNPVHRPRFFASWTMAKQLVSMRLGCVYLKVAVENIYTQTRSLAWRAAGSLLHDDCGRTAQTTGHMERYGSAVEVRRWNVPRLIL